MTIIACITVLDLNFENDFSGSLFYTRLGDVQRTRHGGLNREVGYQAHASTKLTPIPYPRSASFSLRVSQRALTCLPHEVRCSI